MSTVANDNLQRVMRKVARAYRNGSGCRLSRQDVRDLMDAALAKQPHDVEHAAAETDLGTAPPQLVEGGCSR